MNGEHDEAQAATGMKREKKNQSAEDGATMQCPNLLQDATNKFRCRSETKWDPLVFESSLISVTSDIRILTRGTKHELIIKTNCIDID